jgi:MFS family permease
MTNTSITAETSSQPRLRGFALISVITALMLTLLLEALDQTIVGTAMPRIIEALHGLDRYSWVVTAYILATMTMIPIVGKLSDQFGRKWFLLSGTVLFLLGSILLLQLELRAGYSKSALVMTGFGHRLMMTAEQRPGKRLGVGDDLLPDQHPDQA